MFPLKWQEHSLEFLVRFNTSAFFLILSFLSHRIAFHHLCAVRFLSHLSSMSCTHHSVTPWLFEGRKWRKMNNLYCLFFLPFCFLYWKCLQKVPKAAHYNWSCHRVDKNIKIAAFLWDSPLLYCTNRLLLFCNSPWSRSFISFSSERFEPFGLPLHKKVLGLS